MLLSGVYFELRTHELCIRCSMPLSRLFMDDALSLKDTMHFPVNAETAHGSLCVFFGGLGRRFKRESTGTRPPEQNSAFAGAGESGPPPTVWQEDKVKLNESSYRTVMHGTSMHIAPHIFQKQVVSRVRSFGGVPLSTYWGPS